MTVSRRGRIETASFEKLKKFDDPLIIRADLLVSGSTFGEVEYAALRVLQLRLDVEMCVVHKGPQGIVVIIQPKYGKLNTRMRAAFKANLHLTCHSLLQDNMMAQQQIVLVSSFTSAH